MICTAADHRHPPARKEEFLESNKHSLAQISGFVLLRHPDLCRGSPDFRICGQCGRNQRVDVLLLSDLRLQRAMEGHSDSVSLDHQYW